MNGVIIPPIYSNDSKTYYNASNKTVTVHRISEHIRVFKVWNASINIVQGITLDSIDRPPTAMDSPLFVTDAGKVGRFRINGQNGTITAYVLDSYASGTFITSDTSSTFIEFFYMV